jgi:hypothetical protein
MNEKHALIAVAGICLPFSALLSAYTARMSTFLSSLLVFLLSVGKVEALPIYCRPSLSSDNSNKKEMAER